MIEWHAHTKASPVRALDQVIRCRRLYLMTTRQEDIAAVLDHAAKEFAEVEEKYAQALSSKRVSASLRIQVKDIFGNLRAALDYLAKDVHEARCGAIPTGKRLYFPILPDRATFVAKMNTWFPGLASNAADLWAYLESVQPYHAGNAWLGQFNDVNNGNKHDRLIEQTRTETPEIRVETSGGVVSWNPSGVTFGPGVSMGGVPIDPHTQLPTPHPSQKITKTIWVDFQFEGVPVSALGLMSESVEGVTRIAREVRTRLS
jgi:hypothetical protein